MRRPIIAREGWPFAAALLILALLALLVHWALALLPALLTLFVLWFFRDPERPIPEGERLVVSPADGRVMFVREVEEPRFMGGRAILVSIFLSVFDVHINRAPVAGEVRYREYVPGQFLAAWDETVGEVNERAYLGLVSGPHRVLVSQVAGLLARRIITWPQVGDRLQRGERFGLIRFGSCTQLWLPPGSEVLVGPGDRVAGGKTVIGRLPQ
ncbi:phosphatidylserine decarboxylase [Symbiobacterium terraclitae]|uniref:Phosphatidylserine decarboxylase proenzyme n=1 Tax=Symbiobacterium terraclitae TaxID=557451 RepID=A0ABS4JPD4_9FIRM|nr:phosphatidylserine decarboxylase family protein [Symbiobacterium terraclitae]MBP2016830.1 phosphatidylserine decarboxylase [Symbiobacterium terraclitae]